MSGSKESLDPGPRKRRYLVHLCCKYDEDNLTCRYIANIRLWTVRGNSYAQAQECAFVDEYELIETINALLPHGSDVRDVLGHIERPDGFLYLLNLTFEEAESLGWSE